MRDITSPWTREAVHLILCLEGRRRPLSGRRRSSTPGEVTVLGKTVNCVHTATSTSGLKKMEVYFFLSPPSRLMWPKAPVATPQCQGPRPFSSSGSSTPEAPPSCVSVAQNHRVCNPASGGGQAEGQACSFLQRAQFRRCTAYFCSHPRT